MEDINKFVRELRKDFSGEPLDESHINPNPLLQFEHWFKEAVKADVNEPNAMVLSTVAENHKPSARVVLLREFTTNGFARSEEHTSELQVTDVSRMPSSA